MKKDRWQLNGNCFLWWHYGLNCHNQLSYQTANICWIIEKAREFQGGKITSDLLTMAKLLTVWITTNCGKFFKRWEYQTTWPASWETCTQVKKQWLDLDMKPWTSSKLGKEYSKLVCCHPDHLTYTQSTSCEMQGWISTSWNQDCWEKYQ